MSVKQQVRLYIRTFVLYEDPDVTSDADSELKDDASLVESDMIDSTGVMELVSHLEKTFDINIPTEMIDPEMMDTVNQITALVESMLDSTSENAA